MSSYKLKLTFLTCKNPEIRFRSKTEILLLEQDYAAKLKHQTFAESGDIWPGTLESTRILDLNWPRIHQKPVERKCNAEFKDIRVYISQVQEEQIMDPGHNEEWGPFSDRAKARILRHLDQEETMGVLIRLDWRDVYGTVDYGTWEEAAAAYILPLQSGEKLVIASRWVTFEPNPSISQ